MLGMQVWNRVRKPILTIFILGHLIGLSAYLLPESPLRDVIVTPFIPYIQFFSLMQEWSVFAPNPSKWSTYITADIEFKDGSISSWEFPRVEKMNVVEKLPGERLRKWSCDRVGNPGDSIAWPDAIAYVARQNRNPTNPPVFITLLKHRVLTPIPEDASNEEPKEEIDLLYTGKVDAGDAN